MKTAFISVTVIALVISTLPLLAADTSHSMDAIQQQIVSKEREELESLKTGDLQVGLPVQPGNRGQVAMASCGARFWPGHPAAAVSHPTWGKWLFPRTSSKLPV